MTDKQSLTINIASLCAITGAFAYFSQTIADRDYRLRYYFDFFMSGLAPDFNVPIELYVVLAFCLFLFGTILPHMDDEESLIAYFHIYVPLGVWTHAIWLPLLFFMAAFKYHLCFWVAFGYFLHLFWDSVSDYGICLLYPFSKYTNKRGVGVVKQKHRFFLYRVGGRSETAFVVVVVMVSLVCVYFGITSCFATAAF